MNEFFDALRRVGVLLIAIAVGGIALLVVLRALLPRIANVVTLFVATPGGLLLVIAVWWWPRRKQSRS